MKIKRLPLYEIGSNYHGHKYTWYSLTSIASGIIVADCASWFIDKSRQDYIYYNLSECILKKVAEKPPKWRKIPTIIQTHGLHFFTSIRLDIRCALHNFCLSVQLCNLTFNRTFRAVEFFFLNIKSIKHKNLIENL